MPTQTHTDQPWKPSAADQWTPDPVASSGSETRHRNQKIGFWVILGTVAAVIGLAALGNTLHPTRATPGVPVSTYVEKMNRCTYEAAGGTVQNTSGAMTNIQVWVNFVDSDGTQLASGVGSIYNLPPGGVANWTADAVGHVSGNFRCKIAKVYQYRS